MNCQCCQKQEGALDGYPFDLIETLYKNVYAGHEVFTHKCKLCNALYAGVDLETGHGNHTWWAAITYDEVQELLKLKGMPEIVDRVIQLIESKDGHIVRDSQRHYFYKAETAQVV